MMTNRSGLGKKFVREEDDPSVIGSYHSSYRSFHVMLGYSCNFSTIELSAESGHEIIRCFRKALACFALIFLPCLDLVPLLALDPRVSLCVKCDYRNLIFCDHNSQSKQMSLCHNVSVVSRLLYKSGCMF